MFKISIVVFGDEEVAFRIHAVLDLRDRKQDDNDDRNARIAEEAHNNRECRPYRIPVKHAEVSAVLCHADPACDEGSADKTGEEGDNQAGFETAFSFATRPMVALSKKTGTNPQMMMVGDFVTTRIRIAMICPTRPARKPNVTALESPKPKQTAQSTPGIEDGRSLSAIPWKDAVSSVTNVRTPSCRIAR